MAMRCVEVCWRRLEIYVPDTERSTAGMHVIKVLRSLGIHAEVAARLRTYPNGATAMLELSRASEPRSIGITQVTEIIATPGVDLVGSLPSGFELSTVYSAAACTKAREPDARATFRAAAGESRSRLPRGSVPAFDSRGGYSWCSSLRISRNLAFTFASLSGPIRTRIF